MDRGEALTLRGSGVPYGALNAGCDPYTKCQANEHVIVVTRPGGDVRLSASPTLNAATCRRAWCELILAIPSLGSLVACLWCCIAPPTARYELQDANRAPLGATYTEKKYTCCYVMCRTGGQPTGAFVDFSTASLQARRDLVAALVARIGATAATPTG